jgi:hypothetical protein
MYYRGSNLLTSLATYLSIPLDHVIDEIIELYFFYFIFLTDFFILFQLNFIVSEFLALIAGILFRKLLPPKSENVLKRHLTEIIIGFALSYFCYGINFIHVLIQSTIAYLLLAFCPRNYAHLYYF